MPQSRLSTPSWLSLRATCRVQNPATSLVGADITAAALPTPNGRKRPFAGQAARALQSPTLGVLWRPADVMELSHLKHERLLDSPSPWNVHAETFKRTHGHVTSLLEAPLATAPGQPVPHHRVGQFALWRFPVMQPSDIQVWEACPLPEHAWFVPDNCCICTAIGFGCVSLGGGDYDGDLLKVHIQSHPPQVPWLIWLHAQWHGSARIQCCSSACGGSCGEIQPDPVAQHNAISRALLACSNAANPRAPHCIGRESPATSFWCIGTRP